jgi:cell division protein FtsB
VASARGHEAAHAAPGPLSMRGWLVILGGAMTAVIILVAWLPVGALLNQRAQLSAASERLAQLSKEGSALAAESAELRSTTGFDQIAREQYQLVAPGQRLIQVLTPSFTPSAKSKGGPYPGDPGFSAIVDPTGTTSVGSTSSRTTSTASTSSTAPSAPSPGFVSRVVATLEFWR